MRFLSKFYYFKFNQRSRPVLDRVNDSTDAYGEAACELQYFLACPRGRWNFSKYFPKLFLGAGRDPTPGAPHGQGLGLAGGAHRVYVFTAKSGWELARIIVYKMSV